MEWAELVRIAFVALAAAAVWFRLWEPFPHISVIGIAATLIGGYPIFKEAFENIVERKMTMELSMTIALLSALAIGEFFTALVITGFVLAAEVLGGSHCWARPACHPGPSRFPSQNGHGPAQWSSNGNRCDQVQSRRYGHRETGWTYSRRWRRAWWSLFCGTGSHYRGGDAG